jgi:PAS domain S-box-containing protein
MRPIEMYRSIFENAVEGIFQTSPDGRYVNVNPALARIYGYDSPEDLIESVTDIAGQLYVDPERRDEFVAMMACCGEVSDFESEIYRKDGTTCWIRESVRAVCDSRGDLVYYEGFVTDITERKENEAELEETRQELERRVAERTRELAQSEGTLRTLLDAMQESVILIDPDSTVLAVNARGATRYGFEHPDQMIGRRLYDLLDPELADQRRMRNEDVLRTGLPIRWVDNRDGMEFETFVYPVVMPSELVQRLAIISKDVSNLRKLEKALQQS